MLLLDNLIASDDCFKKPFINSNDSMQISSLVILSIKPYSSAFIASTLFAENINSRTSKFYRIINEIPTVLLIGIILVVVFKPL